VTIRCEIQTENIRSLGFGDIREGFTLRRLILWSFEWILLFVKSATNGDPLKAVATKPSTLFFGLLMSISYPLIQTTGFLENHNITEQLYYT
jgi:hypothetical protein